MRLLHRFRAFVLFAILGISFTLVAVEFAEARRGGGFGSRGLRTFTPPAATRTAPREAQPINRSMTPRQQNAQPGQQGAQPGQPGAQRAGAAQGQRGGLFGGMMGGLLGGLMLGGLIGMLLGNGIGGLAGFLGLLLQVGLVIVVVMLVMRFLRSRNAPAFAGGAPRENYAPDRFDYSPGGNASADGGSPIPTAGTGSHGDGTDEIGITNEDLDSFEQLLVEIQAAFAREDFAGIRDRTTPEVASFFSEELSENAVNGLKNDVSDVRLLQGDLAEAWREGDQEYATVAMLYESIDVMRDRQTGEVLEGREEPTQTTEVWTFVRENGGKWLLTAIQDS
ncbi:MAG: TIM44-like domain-containing protein [Pseudomonadota bacterium]